MTRGGPVDRNAYNAYMRDYLLRRYHERMAEAKAKLGGACAACGISERLELDHIDPTDKSFTIASMWSVSRARFDAELAKCQLLCRDCHTSKSITERGQTPARGTHGTISAYRHCGPPKCELCKQAKREYYQKSKNSRRP